MNTLKYFKTVNKNVPGVYAIVNAYDMKIYIGSTTNLSKRSKQHSNDLMYFFNTSERFEKPFQKNFGIKSYNIKNVIYRKERFL